jgi:DeoR family transcriptional regulator, deoxyribose operon repressor
MLDRSDRLRQLDKNVLERGSVRIEEAARVLGCSPMTVRRDVASVPERFVLLGGHIVAAGLGKPYDLNQELMIHLEEKSALCARAIERIEDGDTVFIDCGTTTANLASHTPPNLRLTVVCYALNIAELFARKSNVRLILLGGLYNASSASFEVPDSPTALSRLGINKGFFSAAGVHAARGVTCANFHEVAVKQAAMAIALEKHLLIDSSKIGKVAPAAFASLDDFDTIIVSRKPAASVETQRIGERLVVA